MLSFPIPGETRTEFRVSETRDKRLSLNESTQGRPSRLGRFLSSLKPAVPYRKRCSDLLSLTQFWCVSVQERLVRIVTE